MKPVLFLILFILHLSCHSGARSIQTFSSSTQTEKPSKSSTESLEPPRKEVESKKNSKVKWDEPLQIALLLPFQADSVPVDRNPAIEFGFTRNTKVSIEYLSGVRLAADSLSKLNWPVDVHVFDTDARPEKVREITTNPALKSMDAVIGPAFNSEIKVAIEFCNNYSIPLFSPFSPIEPEQFSPRYFMLNPSYRQYIRGMHRYIGREWPNYPTILVYPNQTQEAGWAEEFVGCNALDGHRNLNIKRLYYNQSFQPFYPAEWDSSRRRLYRETFSIDDVLKKDQMNVLVVLSMDLSLVLRLSRELYRLKDQYPITVVGLPVWGRQDELNLEYIEKLNVHFTDAYIDPAVSESYTTIEQNIIETYGFSPGMYFWKGFDHMMLIAQAFADNRSQPHAALVNMKRSGSHSDFRFEPQYGAKTSAEQILRMENTSVYMLRYHQYQIQKVGNPW